MAEVPFEELSEAELNALGRRVWTVEEISRAVEMAIEYGDQEAVTSLLQRMADINPLAAQVTTLSIAMNARRSL